MVLGFRDFGLGVEGLGWLLRDLDFGDLSFRPLGFRVGVQGSKGLGVPPGVILAGGESQIFSGFPTFVGIILGTPIIRTIVFWALYWGAPILGRLFSERPGPVRL